LNGTIDTQAVIGVSQNHEELVPGQFHELILIGDTFMAKGNDRRKAVRKPKQDKSVK
jgi:hypothetical protein